MTSKKNTWDFISPGTSGKIVHKVSFDCQHRHESSNFKLTKDKKIAQVSNKTKQRLETLKLDLLQYYCPPITKLQNAGFLLFLYTQFGFFKFKQLSAAWLNSSWTCFNSFSATKKPTEIVSSGDQKLFITHGTQNYIAEKPRTGRWHKISCVSNTAVDGLSSGIYFAGFKLYLITAPWNLFP